MRHSVRTKQKNIYDKYDDLISETIEHYKKGELSKEETQVLLRVMITRQTNVWISETVKNLVQKYLKSGLGYV